jgi:hypothetical protein
LAVVTTQLAECTFVVKFGADRPFVAVEPAVAGLLISLDLKEGTTVEAARALAKIMRQHIVSIAVTVTEEPDVPNIVEGPTTKR